MRAAAVGLSVVLLLCVCACTRNAWAEDESASSCDNEQAQKDEKKDEKANAALNKNDECRERCKCRKKPDVELSVMGIRPSVTHVSTAGRTTNDMGVAFAGVLDSYALKDTAHSSMQWILGGGQAGFEGMLGGVIEIGYRADVTDKTGPFGRVGFDGRIQGNDRLYFSALELPRMSLGWQFMSQKTVLEVGARGGPILTGRFNPGDDGHRSISGSMEYGGFASIQFDFIRLEANALRIDARKTGDHSPVDVGRAALCGVTGKVGICADFNAFRGTARFGAAGQFQEAVATSAGLTFGVASW